MNIGSIIIIAIMCLFVFAGLDHIKEIDRNLQARTERDMNNFERIEKAVGLDPEQYK